MSIVTFKRLVALLDPSLISCRVVFPSSLLAVFCKGRSGNQTSASDLPVIGGYVFKVGKGFIGPGRFGSAVGMSAKRQGEGVNGAKDIFRSMTSRLLDFQSRSLDLAFKIFVLVVVHENIRQGGSGHGREAQQGQDDETRSFQAQ